MSCNSYLNSKLVAGRGIRTSLCLFKERGLMFCHPLPNIILLLRLVIKLCKNSSLHFTINDPLCNIDNTPGLTTGFICHSGFVFKGGENDAPVKLLREII